MPELQRLRSDHAAAVLDFEVANRGYFAESISDRGDDYFEHFADRHQAMLDDQAAGIGAYYLLVAEDGSVLGRFNLSFIGRDVANLGYRMAQQATGRGLATAAVQQLCHLAVQQHGLRTLLAATSHENAASSRVLVKAGFVSAGPADLTNLGGKAGTAYELALSSAPKP